MRIKPTKTNRGFRTGVKGRKASPLDRAAYGNLNRDAVKVASDLIALASHRSEIEKIIDPALRQRVYQALAMAPTNGSIPNNAPKGHHVAKMLVVYSLNQFISAAERGDAKFFFDVGQSIEQGFGRKSPVDRMRFALATWVNEGRPTKEVDREDLVKFVREKGGSGDVSNIAKAARKQGISFQKPGRPKGKTQGPI